MAGQKWKFTFRQDQCEMIIAAMDYVIARADERISGHAEVGVFDRFASERTRERAGEIRDEVADTIGE